MQQLTYIKPKTLAWWEVPEPRLKDPGGALVRPVAAARCDGDSVFLLHNYEALLRVGAALHVVDPAFGRARDDVFHGPFAYGHECVAEVVEVGATVGQVAVGDLVVVPWAVSCGSCGRCGQGLTSHCERERAPIAAYGLGDAVGTYGGMVSDLLYVPYADAMLVPVPTGLAPQHVVSASDNMSDAHRSVAPQLARAPGAPVLIIGGAAKSIGLYAAGMAVALGSSRVDYIDTDTRRLQVAERLGAHPVALTKGARWFTRGAPLRSDGYPISVEASGSVAGLRYALSSLSPGGACTALAFYMRRTTPLPLWNMYLKSATLHVGVSHPRKHIPEVLSLIARGAFDPSALDPLTADWRDAARVFLEPATKVIVTRARRHERVARQDA